MAEGREQADRTGKSPMQFLGRQKEWTERQYVLSSDQTFQPQEMGMRPERVQKPELQGFSSALYGLRTEHPMEPSSGKTRGTETD